MLKDLCSKSGVITIFSLTLAISFSSPLWAALTNDNPLDISSSGESSSLQATNFYLLNQVHVSKRSALVQVESAIDFDGEEMTELSGKMLDLPSGSVLTIVDESFDKRFVTLSLDIEGIMASGQSIEGLPNLIEISSNELSKMDLSMVQLSFEDGEEEFVLPEMVAGKRRGKAAMTYCLGDVRTFAGNSKNCGKGVPTPAAGKGSLAYAAFKKAGWKPISRKSWKSYPKCTACFYAGGRQDCTKLGNGKGPKKYECGHAAVKISSNRWKGAGVRSVPGLPNKNGTFRGVKRKSYKFHGCLIHPNSQK